MSDEQGFTEDGVFWGGTWESLEAWKAYKKVKAIAFVERGYSVEWYPDGHNAMTISVPERWYAGAPETAASVYFFRDPSKFGINGGKISKLFIREVRPTLSEKLLIAPINDVRVLYNYDRGPDVDLLHTSTVARRLYDDVLAELNA